MTQKQNREIFDKTITHCSDAPLCRMPENGRRESCQCFDNESYIERMHKCSAAQWDKRRLESRRRKKLNESEAGVLNTGISSGADHCFKSLGSASDCDYFKGFSNNCHSIGVMRSQIAFDILCSATNSARHEKKCDQ